MKIMRFILSWVFSPFFVPIFLSLYVAGIVIWVIIDGEEDLWDCRPGQHYFKWMTMRDV